MATYQRPPTNPVVDAHRSSRWPIFLVLFVGIAAIGGGIAYDRYVANAPIVLTPTKPTEPGTKARPAQPTTPSTQPTRPGAKPPQTSSGMPEWMPAVFFAIPIIFVAVIVFVIVGFVRRARRMASGGATVSGGSTGHWAGGQHVGAGGAAAGPWARQPGVVTTGNVASTPQDAPAKRKGGGIPLLPIIVGAIILDQAILNGRYSRMALDWIMKFVEGFNR